MKTHLITRWLGSIALGVALLTSTFLAPKAEAKVRSGVGFQVFYDELAPYGDWVKDARYGYIWLPAVRGDFHPYGTEGHWVMTEYGNTWVSYYDWGWAPFHYGRWYFDDYFQSWAWIPGYDWGPAWVDWRTGGGYYGWAPLGPSVSIRVNVAIPSFHWVFIPNHRIYHQHAYRYYAPHKTKVKIYNNTTIINNTVVYNNRTYVSGPQRREVERVTRASVPVYSVQGSKGPGAAAVSRGSVTLYRPEVQESRGRNTDVRPSRVLDAQQAKSARSSRELNSGTPSRSGSVSPNSGGRSIESTPRGGQNTSPSRGSATPGRSVSTSRESEKKPVVTPMPNDSQRRSTTTAPSRSQSPETRQATPARAPEVKKEAPRSTQSSPARGSVQQSRPSQAPARTQSPQVRNTTPAKSQVSQPSRSQSSTQVKSAAPQRKSTSTTSRTSSSSSGRSSSNGRNN